MVDPRHLLPPVFGVTSSVADGVFIVTATGDLDIASCEPFLAAVARFDGQAELRLDLRDLTFLDSSGVRALLIARRDAEAHGARLRVLASEPARATLELTGLGAQLPLDG